MLARRNPVPNEGFIESIQTCLIWIAKKTALSQILDATPDVCFIVRQRK
jgi:hypothetical protein